MTNLITLMGDYGYDPYKISEISSTVIDATDASWIVANIGDDLNRYPFSVRDSYDVTIIGGTIDGTVPLDLDWEDAYVNSAAVYVRNVANVVISDWTISQTWDAIRVRSVNDDSFAIDHVWISDVRDDAVENDDGLSGTISNSLFDGVFVGVSLADGSTPDQTDNVVTLDNVLIRMESFQYKGELTHQSIFKVVDGISPALSIKDCVLAIEDVNHHGQGRLAVAWDSVVSSSGNYFLNLSDDPLPDDYPLPPAGFTILQGQAARDYWNNARTDWIAENSGDSLTGTSGADSIDGQDGSDTILGGDGNDTLNGQSGHDSLLGEAGHDRLIGVDGDDILVGGDGFDTIYGGNGNDTVDGGHGRDQVFLNQGNDLYQDNGQGGDLGRDTVFGGYGDDTIQGGNGDDEFRGQGGNDLIFGRKGNDLIRGDDGFDTIHSGTGNDTVNGGNGRDRVFLKEGDDLYQDNGQGGDLGRDTVFAGTGDDTIQGGAGDDLFTGDTGNDVIYARLGNDSVYGGNNFDFIDAGEGNDLVYGGNGQDTIRLGAGDDVYVDTAQTGNLGRDTITGGTGADVFVFLDVMSSDTITDFETGTDVLQLEQGLWNGGLTAAQVVSTYASVTADGVLFDFGAGQSILLSGLGSTDGLDSDLLLI